MVQRNFFNEFPNFNQLIGIQTIGGFIEYHQFWLMNDCLCNTHTLTVTSGEVAYQPVTEMSDAAALLDTVNGNFFIFRSSIRRSVAQ